mgnify:CR=1 FL=1
MMEERILAFHVGMFERTLGISCVENHYASFLLYKNLPLEYVFYKSYEELPVTVRRLYTQRKNYANYDAIERIQSVGERIGLARSTFLRHVPTEQLRERMESSLANDRPLLMRIKPDGLPSLFGLTPLRDDHFVMVHGYDQEQVYLLEDYPQRALKLPWDQLDHIYAGDTITFEELDKFEADAYMALVMEELAQWRHAAEDEKLPSILEQAASMPEDLVYIRDAVGIHRIVTRRMLAWVNGLQSNARIFADIVPSQIEETAEMTNRLYGLLEACRLRKRADARKLHHAIDDIARSGRQWVKAIQDALEENNTLLRRSLV